MFIELLPLLAKHSLILTVGTVKDGAIRVTVTPRPSGKDSPKEISQPFVVEGTAAELDADLPKAITEYASQLMTLEAGLAEVKANMDAALAEAKQEADKKVAEAKAKNKTTGKPVTTKPAVSEPPKLETTPSLFDAPASLPTIVAAPAPVSTDDVDGDDDDEIASEESDATDEDDSSPTASNVCPISTPPSTVEAATTTTNLFSLEQEILEEVLYGSEDNLVAA